MILKMTSTLVVETSVTINNGPAQDYTNPDDQPATNINFSWKSFDPKIIFIAKCQSYSDFLFDDLLHKLLHFATNLKTCSTAKGPAKLVGTFE